METRNVIFGSEIVINGIVVHRFDSIGDQLVELPGDDLLVRVLPLVPLVGGTLSTEQAEYIDAAREERENKLVSALLLIIGSALLESEGKATPDSIFGDVLTEDAPGEIAGWMADAHLDSFDLYKATPTPGRREELIREYTGAATEAVAAMLVTIGKGIAAAEGDLAKGLVIAGYSKSDSSGIELGAERNIVTASNAGLFEGAVFAPGFTGKVTGLRHNTIEDGRQTDICDDRAGLQLPVSDKYWETNWPSLHFRCRSIITVLRGEFQVSQQLPSVPPLPGFGRAPASVLALLRRGGRVAA